MRNVIPIVIAALTVLGFQSSRQTVDQNLEISLRMSPEEQGALATILKPDKSEHQTVAFVDLKIYRASDGDLRVRITKDVGGDVLLPGDQRLFKVLKNGKVIAIPGH